MNRVTAYLRPSAALPLRVAGSVLVLVGALLPWATFVLNKGAYPGKATLQFFDAPFAITSFRLHVALLGLAALALSFVPVPGRNRVLRGLGYGVVAVAAINLAFIVRNGGGLGAVTISDGSAFGGVVALLGGLALVAGGYAGGLEEPVRLPTRMNRYVAWVVLLVAFAALLKLVTSMLTTGGQGVANPYAGAQFLSFLGFAGGLLAALHGAGVLPWISRLSEDHRPFSVLVLLGCALALPFTDAGSDYWITVATNIGVYSATAIGLNVVVGLAGLLDIGYVAFLGIGAFVAANLSGAAASKLDITLPFGVAAVIAAVVAGMFGSIVGSPTLRVRGDYLAIVTLAFGEIFVRSAQNNIGGLTGGSNAIPGVPPVELAGTGFDESIKVAGRQLPSGVLYYFLVVLLVALVMGMFANLKNSRIGRAWIAIREDEDVAKAMGIPTGRVKILAFMVGATTAGLSGAVFAHHLHTVSYESFKFLESVTLLAAVILGGMGSIPGAVLGASLLFVLPEKLREFSDYRLLLFGLALVLIMRFRPQGLVPDRHRRAELAGEDFEGRPLEESATEQAHLPPVAAASPATGHSTDSATGPATGPREATT
jgi:branched-chain amino acid transport system permease protein